MNTLTPREGQSESGPKTPEEFVDELRSTFRSDEDFLFALNTHLRLFQAEGNEEASKLTQQAIAYLSSLPARLSSS